MIDLVKLVRTRFAYEPDTGRMKRVDGLGRKEYPWRRAGTGGRYLAHTITKGGASLYLHQAVWLFHHGYLPDMIDHINNNGHDCRIENLRPCTPGQNQHNSKVKTNNKSGYKGVAYYPKMRKPWRARIVVDKKVIPLGYFSTPEEAALAYLVGAETHARCFARIK